MSKCNNYDEFIEANKDILLKYKNLIVVQNKKTGNYYLKNHYNDVTEFIEDMKSLGLGKDMICYNIKKFGFDEQKEYILQELK